MFHIMKLCEKIVKRRFGIADIRDIYFKGNAAAFPDPQDEYQP